tara:strand:+ start:227 stop:460 length:234 start_codon:yes stop_codon:yes gene_type:complete
VLKKLTIPFFFLLSCNGVGNMEILQDQNGNGHFYNEIILFNADSTQKWCYTHEQFEVIKRDKKLEKYEALANSYRMF